MKKEDFKNKTDAELSSMLKGARDRVSAIRFGGTSGKVKNVKESMMTKRNVARILTEVTLRKKAVAKK